MRSILIPATAILLCHVSAHAQHGDLGFRIDGGRLVTWFVDDSIAPPNNFVEPSRVFEGELALVTGIVTGDEPGFLGEAGTLSGFHMGFNVLKAARVWDVSAQHFLTISPSTLTMSAPVVGGVTTPAADPASPVAGPNILAPAGEFHFHYDYTLNGTGLGIYLLELQLTTDKPGVLPSLPFWISLNYGLSETEHEASVEWVHDNLVPAPGSVAVLAWGAAIGLRRRRRSV